MYFQQTNSAQRNIPVIQLQTPFNNQQYSSPTNQYYSIPSQPRPFLESPKANNMKEQLDSLYINLRKENQSLKDKLQHISAQVDEAQQKLEQYKKS
ncbi:unnamed protein product [Paramecium pentaurelia]|uniref:Uncharacterized protein n=1 Tax=Paramecium pentaurelia TaxID=43138 RepID=A0A8S1VFG8_9CILI|nr:unnamed protein product [Paramecium pentaurelia]